MYQDDVITKLESDIQRIRQKFRMYISFAGSEAATSIFKEILYNAIDECKNPRSPGNKIHIEFDEQSGFVTVEDNGRGIDTTLLEEIFTTLNMGSNIDSSDKSELKMDSLGTNGTGSLAICGLGECTEIRSYRGPSEGICKTIVFEEGNKITEETFKCSKDKHGLYVRYKPSQILGKGTKLIWKDIHNELLNFQYLNKDKIKIDSIYTDKKGKVLEEIYKATPFVDILNRNDKEQLISQKYYIRIESNDVTEEYDTGNISRFLILDIGFCYSSDMLPYSISFSNSNNTVDNGDHFDACVEGLCRFLQMACKNSMSEKERDKLDIKWEDVKSGLSLVVSMHTNYEKLYTSQTKHKVSNADIKKIIVNLFIDELEKYFNKNQSQLRDLINIVKTNAKARREGDKIKSAVVKGNLSKWSAYKIKNYDPCANNGSKDYKEIYLIEGDSAKGSLKQARDPHYQALYAFRGVSKNVFKAALDQIVGQKGNKEFTDLINIMGCNVGPKFDINKLQFNKIIIASDADVDGLFIRSLLMAFFFKLFPEIIKDDRLYIAEPPLYRVDDKKDPFVINKEDYISRYTKLVTKDYRIGYIYDDNSVDYMKLNEVKEFLRDTSQYVDDIKVIADHYKINERLLEILFEECATHPSLDIFLQDLTIQSTMNRINNEFPELNYDYKRNLIMGSIDAKMQLIEINKSLIKKSQPLQDIILKYGSNGVRRLLLKDNKTGNEHDFSMLELLKVLKKYQPDILHRFKGLNS